MDLKDGAVLGEDDIGIEPDVARRQPRVVRLQPLEVLLLDEERYEDLLSLWQGSTSLACSGRTVSAPGTKASACGRRAMESDPAESNMLPAAAASAGGCTSVSALPTRPRCRKLSLDPARIDADPHTSLDTARSAPGGAVTPAPHAAQTTTATATQTPVFPARTAAVFARRGRPGQEGAQRPRHPAEEIEIYEDASNKGRELQAGRGRAAEGRRRRRPRAKPDAARQLNLVTLVFDQLGTEAKRLAEKAGHSFIERALRPNTWVAVFRIDQRLALVQPFTNDAAKLKAAVVTATSGTLTGSTDAGEGMERAHEEASPSQRPGAVSESPGPPAAAPLALVPAQALINMLRLSNTLQRQQSGSTSLYPLMALMRGHETLAGRKTLLYISQGLQVPPNLEAVFRSTVSAANRANVSIYAIDARGLDAGANSPTAGQLIRRDKFRRARSRAAAAPVQGRDLSRRHGRKAVRRTRGTLSDLRRARAACSPIPTLPKGTGRSRRSRRILRADLHAPPAPMTVLPEHRGKIARKDVEGQARSGYFRSPSRRGLGPFAYEVRCSEP